MQTFRTIKGKFNSASNHTSALRYSHTNYVLCLWMQLILKKKEFITHRMLQRALLMTTKVFHLCTI